MSSQSPSRASYLHLAESGLLATRREAALKNLHACTLCPHQCATNRYTDKKDGLCRTGRLAPVASYTAHFGEEAPLVGTNGSGTVFFGSCNLFCSFCQNHEISHHGESGSSLVTENKLAEIFIRLQDEGCHNINLVTPTHCVPQIIGAIEEASRQGLIVPIIYNNSGYETKETLDLLDGIIDIYLPDIKFWSNTTAARFTKSQDYGDRAREAVKQMYQQVGNLEIDKHGVAVKGLLVRHLVLPGLVEESLQIIKFLSQEIPQCSVNLMDQYHPCNKVSAPLDKSLPPADFQRVIDAANKSELKQLNGNSLLSLLKKLGLY